MTLTFGHPVGGILISANLHFVLLSVPLPDLQRRQPDQLRRVGLQHGGAPAARQGQEPPLQGGPFILL